MKLIQPEVLPKMVGGLVVPPFDPSITACGYCGKALKWEQIKKGGTEESWAAERKAFDDARKGLAPYPIIAFGRPRTVWTYGCPRYGEHTGSYESRKSALSLQKVGIAQPWEMDKNLGWHFYWWEDEYGFA